MKEVDPQILIDTGFYVSDGQGGVAPKYVYRKDKRTGGWSVMGPAEELSQAVGDSETVTACKKDGQTSAVQVLRVSKSFEVDGVTLAYGTLAPRPRRSSSYRRYSSSGCPNNDDCFSFVSSADACSSCI